MGYSPPPRGEGAHQGQVNPPLWARSHLKWLFHTHSSPGPAPQANPSAIGETLNIFSHPGPLPLGALYPAYTPGSHDMETCWAHGFVMKPVAA